MTKNFKQILLAVAFIAGISVSASAQRDGDKKPPPKKDPPIIVVNPDKKPPKEGKPKGDKKPQALMFNNRNEINFE